MTGYAVDDRIRDLLADPPARAVLERYFPGIGDNEWVRTQPGMRLSLLAHFTGVSADAARAAALAAELGGLERHDPGSVPEEPWPVPASSYESEDVLRSSAEVTIAADATVYRMVQVAVTGPSHGNPFVDVALTALVEPPAGSESGAHRIAGFYDGDGRYLVRFLPDVAGEYRLTLSSDARSLDRITASVQVGAAPEGAHGPVRVEGFGFRHADGTRFLPLGTTCYAWAHQGEALERQTLKTLADAPWSKLRMCVFPKSMVYNENEPERYPFEFTDSEAPHTAEMRDGRRYDRQRFNPDYFRHLETRISQLGELGIDADLILFSPL